MSAIGETLVRRFVNVPTAGVVPPMAGGEAGLNANSANTSASVPIVVTLEVCTQLEPPFTEPDKIGYIPALFKLPGVFLSTERVSTQGTPTVANCVKV